MDSWEDRKSGLQPEMISRGKKIGVEGDVTVQ